MATTVEFQFFIGQEVLIKPLEKLTGRVDGMYYDVNGTTYGVVYWNNGERKRSVMYEWELEAIRRRD